MTPEEIVDLYTNHGKRKLTRELAIACIQYATEQPVQHEDLTPEAVITACNRVFFPGNCLAKGRERKHVLARQCAILVLKNHTFMTLKEIGKVFNSKDHTTVIHSIGAYKALMFTDNEYVHFYNRVLHLLNIFHLVPIIDKKVSGFKADAPKIYFNRSNNNISHVAAY